MLLLGGGVTMAYEMKAKMRPGDKLTVVNLGPSYSFVPSNPWVAVGWRKPEEITVGRQILGDIAAGRVRSVVDYGLSTLNIISCPSCSRVENDLPRPGLAVASFLLDLDHVESRRLQQDPRIRRSIG